ncbi:carbamoyltransferase C-terminal domain-containing protein [Mycobacterium haemophilum]|uniref:Carbamoyltransferase n=1 Tax=Mycobacterium haemophilum TaxID=29311 RepID=A0A0I9UPH6_9MYCO|nr:carbamoyltransferase C-terminal domain-containing protein [Mycobacterium haemophilum]KLO28413.1 hypothetical protein ABH39_14180 [Mycobacterium haemophilum]KLO37454.1 hypothetical protein ABH38_08640 [Mycobacterium haemophilum]KLO44003.1 hypothetical protein ABH37_06165 [Mycobacterium haemophilum]KLO49283.1 hypothetical protein ABH36_13030 [Mycobacterium haemophilum]
MTHLWSAGPGGFLGINYNGMHDSSVCLINGRGEVVYAVNEERFSRVKQDGRFPYRALATVDLTGLAAVSVPYLEASPGPISSAPVFDSLLHRHPRKPVLPYPSVWHERLQRLGLPLLHFDHHEMHAYTGFVLSGYDEAIVLTGDYGAYTCPVTMGVFHVRRGEISLLAGASISDHEALAALYTDVTALLGFAPCKHEGKITGLAARGQPNKECRQQLWALHKQIRAGKYRLYDWVGFLDDRVPPFYEPNRHLVAQFRAQLPFSDADIARAAQDLLDEKLTVIGSWIAENHGKSLPLVVSGGLFANVRANLEMARLGFARLYVAPSMGDDGLSLGAAAAACHQLDKSRASNGQGRGNSRQRGQTAAATSMALGPLPGNNIDRLLDELQAVYTTVDDPAADLAARIADGNVVAVVRGRSEFGPRALGNRSILCRATDPAETDWLNERLRRTEFMPFAPMLRAERVADVFDLHGLSDVTGSLPHMTICLPTRPSIASVAPAVVHVDGTARPQVVTAEGDQFLYRLLTAYEQRTGIPVIINTSFNLHDEPLVNDANDALVAFFMAELDILYLEGRIIERVANSHLAYMVKILQRPGADTRKLRHDELNHSFGRQIIYGPDRFSQLSDTSSLLISSPTVTDDAKVTQGMRP